MLDARQKLAMNIWEELELGLGGGAMFRVILTLTLKPNDSFTKYALVKATGLRTPDITSQLKTLLELGWIMEDNGTALTLTSYRTNLENKVVKIISDLVRNMKPLRMD